jgi:hypothetical protein
MKQKQQQQLQILKELEAQSAELTRMFKIMQINLKTTNKLSNKELKDQMFNLESIKESLVFLQETN